MTTPHEYVDEYGEWNLHSFHNSKLYDDPDYLAYDSGETLPLLSSIGRGPRGAGVIAKKIEGVDGYRIAFINDVTGEALEETPNLDPGFIEVTYPDHNKQEGEAGWMTVSLHRGADVVSYDVLLPPGAHGSRMYLSDASYEMRTDRTYTTNVPDLIHYGSTTWQDKPAPRPGDIVAFKFSEGTEMKLGFGTIESVKDDLVVFTSRTSIGVPIPTLSENDTWVINGVDTGIYAKGPKGDKGDKGDTGNAGPKGPKGDKGEKGINGLPATVVVGNVETLPPTTPVSVSSTHDAVSNTTTLNFGIPEGAAGRAINIRGGIWKPEQLPDYDNTPINDSFIVFDGDKQFDLYVRGQLPVQSSLGGPWTVVEDWQGRPGTGTHVLLNPYELSKDVDGTISIPASETSLAFAPSKDIYDDAIVIDKNMNIGVLSSASDDSGDYVITTKGLLSVRWDIVSGKPFATVHTADGLSIDDNGILFVDRDALSPKWDMVRNKPFSTVDTSGLLDITDDELSLSDINWTNVNDKPFDDVDTTANSSLTVSNGTLAGTIATWAGLDDKPFETIGDGLAVDNGALKSTVEVNTGFGIYKENGVLSADINSISDGVFITRVLPNFGIEFKSYKGLTVEDLLTDQYRFSATSRITQETVILNKRSWYSTNMVYLEDPNGTGGGGETHPEKWTNFTIEKRYTKEDGTTDWRIIAAYSPSEWGSIAEKPFMYIGDGLAISEDGTLSTNVAIPTNVSELTNDSEYQNATQVSNAIANAVPTNVSQLTNDSGYQTATQVSNAITNAVPTKLSQFTNDSGYQTATQVDDAIGSINLSSISGTLPVASGGTGYTSADAAFNSLAYRGDLTDTSTNWNDLLTGYYVAGFASNFPDGINAPTEAYSYGFVLVFQKALFSASVQIYLPHRPRGGKYGLWIRQKFNNNDWQGWAFIASSESSNYSFVGERITSSVEINPAEMYGGTWELKSYHNFHADYVYERTA